MEAAIVRHFEAGTGLETREITPAEMEKAEAVGNGPLDSFVNALAKTEVPKFNITAFHEHSVGQGSDTSAVAYVQITKEDGSQKWGVGKSSNVGRAGIKAVVSAINQ